MTTPFLISGRAVALAIALVGTLLACGGGGGDTATANAANSTTTIPSVTAPITPTEPSSCTPLVGSARLVCLANAFKATLSAADQTKVQYALTQANAVRWSNLPASMSARNGVKFGDLSASSLSAAKALMLAALGTQGEASRENFLLADDVLGTVQSNGYGRANYYLAFIGTPNETSPWILQFTGHHYTSHVTVNGTALSPTPMFIAIEPQTFTVGTTAYEPMGAHRTALYDLLGSLDATQQLSAKLAGTYSDLYVTPGKDGKFPATREGLLANTLSAAQQAKLKTAIAAWVKNVDSGMADALLAEYTSATALADTYVGWTGSVSSTPPQGAYVRIDGPKLWIEFSAQTGIIYRSQVHFHSIWRDKSRDYGGQFSF